MRNFGRVFFGLGGTDERLRQHVMAYGVLTVLWLVLLISRLVSPAPFSSANAFLTVLPIILVVLCATLVIGKVLELRRRRS